MLYYSFALCNNTLCCLLCCPLPYRILSLELILHILERSGPAFKSGDKFIFAIRQYLCVSLLGNCTSHVAQVTGLSLRVFVSLLEGFKAHLKAELEVFITNIFLRILESENSTFDHKVRVLEVFHNICRDPGAQVELFINYDCDFEAIDLFRRIVDAFAKIAKVPASLPTCILLIYILTHSLSGTSPLKP